MKAVGLACVRGVGLSVLALFSWLSWPGAASAQSWTGVVSRVVDGDTVHVKSEPKAKPRTVRILGIDAPEGCQPYGDAARQSLKALALGQVVIVSGTRQDDYGRDLAVLHLRQGPELADLGQLMVRGGHAWSYRFKQDLGPYAEQERQARQHGLGLFANSDAENPGQFRRRHGPCDYPAARR